MSPEAFRLLAAFIGIILLVLLVARLKWHPFLALMFIKYWTTMETLLSILGLAGVLLASLIV